MTATLIIIIHTASLPFAHFRVIFSLRPAGAGQTVMDKLNECRIGARRSSVMIKFLFIRKAAYNYSPIHPYSDPIGEVERNEIEKESKRGAAHFKARRLNLIDFDLVVGGNDGKNVITTRACCSSNERGRRTTRESQSFEILRNACQAAARRPKFGSTTKLRNMRSSAQFPAASFSPLFCCCCELQSTQI